MSVSHVRKYIDGSTKIECKSCEELIRRLRRELEYDRALRGFVKDLIIENNRLKEGNNQLLKRYRRSLMTNSYLQKKLKRRTK